MQWHCGSYKATELVIYVGIRFFALITLFIFYFFFLRVDKELCKEGGCGFHHVRTRQDFMHQSLRATVPSQVDWSFKWCDYVGDMGGGEGERERLSTPMLEK